MPPKLLDILTEWVEISPGPDRVNSVSLFNLIRCLYIYILCYTISCMYYTKVCLGPFLSSESVSI